MYLVLILISIMVFETGCSSSPPPPAANQVDIAPATAPVAPAAVAPQKTVLDDQLKALDKARAVQQQLEEEKAKTDKAIEDGGG